VVPPPPTVARARAAVLRVPGSKSISNRALLLACLGDGPCQCAPAAGPLRRQLTPGPRIKGLLHSDDTQVMLDALHQLGADAYVWEDDGATLSVNGCKGQLRPSDKEVYLGNAGTASRFLTTVCTIVGNHDPAADADRRTVLTGNQRMQKRPIGDLVDALRANGALLGGRTGPPNLTGGRGPAGCDIQYVKTPGSLPLSIRQNCLRGGDISLSAAIRLPANAPPGGFPPARRGTEPHAPPPARSARSTCRRY
jgi:pentafunctional AROM polypeptide